MKMKYTCVFESDGYKTTAKMIENKKVIAKAEAKCNPKDKFDFNKGVEICLERMNDNDTVSNEVKEGDFVKITNPHKVCCATARWFISNRIPVDQITRYAYNFLPTTKPNYIYKVLKIDYNTLPYSSKKLLLIESTRDARIYLMKETGVKKLNKNT